MLIRMKRHKQLLSLPTPPLPFEKTRWSINQCIRMNFWLRKCLPYLIPLIMPILSPQIHLLRRGGRCLLDGYRP